MASQGKGSKRKGGVGEREIVKIFKDHGYEVERTPYSGANKNFPGDVMGAPGLHIEVKRREQTSKLFEGWFAQAEKDRKPGRMSVVLHRKNGGEWMVYCRLDHFMQLYDKATGHNGKDKA
jgi:hypothetical protein